MHKEGSNDVSYFKRCPLIRGRCPEKQLDGCPAWMEIGERNNETGEMRVTKGCVLIHLPRLLMYAEHAANCGAGEISAMRGAVEDGIQQAMRLAGGAAAGLLQRGAEAGD